MVVPFILNSGKQENRSQNFIMEIIQDLQKRVIQHAHFLERKKNECIEIVPKTQWKPKTMQSNVKFI